MLAEEGIRPGSSRCRAASGSTRRTRPTATPCCRRRQGAGLRRGRRRPGLARVRRRPRPDRLARALRRLGRLRPDLRASSASPPRRSPTPPTTASGRHRLTQPTRRPPPTPEEEPMTERLKALSDAGVSIWLDDLSRERIETGNLAELVKDSHVVGVTTNPTIFAAAIADGERYDEQVRELVAAGDSVDRAIFELTTEDVRDACDIFAPGLRGDRGVDGRVSIEVDARPRQRHRGHHRLGAGAVEAVDRPNLFIKIPATKEGLPGDHRRHRRGDQRQRHPDLRPRPLPGGHGRLPDRPRAGARRRLDLGQDPVGRVVLRLPRRHRDRQAPGRRSAPTRRWR